MTMIGTPPVSPRLLAQAPFAARGTSFVEGPFAGDRAPIELDKRLAALPEGKAIVTYAEGEAFFLMTIDYKPGWSADPTSVNGMTPVSVSYRAKGETVTLPVLADPRRERS